MSDSQEPQDQADTSEEAAQESDQIIRDLESERDALFERLQRTSADYHNFMKRTERTRADDLDRARADMLRGFIPVIDTIDQALNSHQPEHDEAIKILEGIRIVRDELLKVMTTNGVERIEPEIGEPFDPHRHEAMLQQPADGVEPNHITLTMSPGYVYKDRALRPAKVAVAPE